MNARRTGQGLEKGRLSESGGPGWDRTAGHAGGTQARVFKTEMTGRKTAGGTTRDLTELNLNLNDRAADSVTVPRRASETGPGRPDFVRQETSG